MAPVFVPPDTYKVAAKAMAGVKPPAPTSSTTSMPPRPRPHKVCPSSWTQDGFDAAQTHDNPAECTLTAANLTASPPQIRWSTPIPAALLGTPAVADGRVIVSGTDRAITAYSAANGRALWRTPTAAGSITGVAVDGGRVYVGGYDGVLYALDASTGRQLWATSMVPVGPNNAGIRAVVISNGRVYATGGNELAAAEGATGHLLWQTAIENMTFSPPVVIGSIVVAGGAKAPGVNYGSDLFGLDANTGAKLWSQSIDVAAFSPVAWGSNVVYGTYQDGAVIADPHSGVVERTVSTGVSGGSLALVGNRLIASSGSQACVDLVTGRQLWNTGELAQGGPSIAGDVEWGHYTDGWAVDLATGRTIGRFPGWAGGAPAIAGGSLYVGAHAGNNWSLVAYGY